MKKISTTLKEFISETLAVASDGGYYDKNDEIKISKNELDNMKLMAEELISNLLSVEKCVLVEYKNTKGEFFLKIFDLLKENFGYVFEYDSDEPSIDFYWIVEPDSITETQLRNDVGEVLESMYDRVV